MGEILESVQETAERIKKLEVRGARNIAIAAIEAIETLASQTKAEDKDEFLRELLEARDILFASRKLIDIITRSDILHAIQIKTELGGEK